jgi:hypothetical protein
MMIAKTPSRSARLQENNEFLNLVPGIERSARFAFRSLRSQEREEAICEVVAYAFCAYRRLIELGKQDLAYATPLARYGVGRFRAGRRVGSKLNSRDVFAVADQRRPKLALESLQSAGSESTIWIEAMADNRLTPIPDQVAFRLDFPAWLGILNRRDRKLVRFLAVGNTTSEAAQRFGVSRSRVSQLRAELQATWNDFQGEASEGTANSKNDSQTGAS